MSQLRFASPGKPVRFEELGPAVASPTTPRYSGVLAIRDRPKPAERKPVSKPTGPIARRIPAVTCGRPLPGGPCARKAGHVIADCRTRASMDRAATTRRERL